MKKFILALTAVAVVSAANAASVGWSLAGATNYAGDLYQFFVIGQNGVEAKTIDSVEYSAIGALQLLLDQGEDVSAYAFGSGTVNTAGSATVVAANSGKSLDAGTYTGFYVIYDSAAPVAGSAKYALVSGATGLTQTFAATKASVTFAAANQANYLNNSSNWQTYGVPEPTTVALLALGLAAVGLKRKVA